MDNYDLFKTIMFQRNVELELQTVDVVERQLGKPLDIYRHGHTSTQDQQKAMEEERMLQETLEKTTKESNSKDEEMKMDEHLQHILDEATKCEEQKELVQRQESKPVPTQREDSDEEPVASGGVKDPADKPKPEVEEAGELSGKDEMEEWIQNSLGCSIECITPEMYQQMPPIVKALVRPNYVHN